MSGKGQVIDGSTRVTLSLSVVLSLVIAVATCVSTALGCYYRIDKRLAHIEDGMSSGVVTYADQENWVLKARAENAQKFPELIWPEVKDQQASVNAPSANTAAE